MNTQYGLVEVILLQAKFVDYNPHCVCVCPDAESFLQVLAFHVLCGREFWFGGLGPFVRGPVLSVRSVGVGRTVNGSVSLFGLCCWLADPLAIHVASRAVYSCVVLTKTSGVARTCP